MTNKKLGILAQILAKFKKNKKNIAVIRLQGIIGSGSIGLRKASLTLHSLKKDIDKAFAIPKLTAVALEINSPGGSPVQTELISKYIMATAKKTNTPLYSFVEDVAASGGYWLACSSDEIYASESSILGSIGVITSGFGFVDMLKKLGIERRIITQGKNKSIYDPFLPTKNEDKNLIELLQKDTHQMFKDVVIDRRGKKLNTKKDEIFDGKFWSGKKSLELGLIDGIGDVYTVMQQKYGEDLKFHFMEREESWLKRKLGISIVIDEIVEGLFVKIKEKIDLIKFGL